MRKVKDRRKSLARTTCGQLFISAQIVPLHFCEDGMRRFQKTIVQASLDANHIHMDRVSPNSQLRIRAQLEAAKKAGGFGITDVARLADSYRLDVLINTLPIALIEFEADALPLPVPPRPTIPEIECLVDRILQDPAVQDPQIRSELMGLKDMNLRRRPLLNIGKDLKSLAHRVRDSISKYQNKIGNLCASRRTL
jgi:hypothetical protein